MIARLSLVLMLALVAAPFGEAASNWDEYPQFIGFRVHVQERNIFLSGRVHQMPHIEYPKLDHDTGVRGRPKFHDLIVQGVSAESAAAKTWFLDTRSAAESGDAAQKCTVTFRGRLRDGNEVVLFTLKGCYPVRWEPFSSSDSNFGDKLWIAFESIQFAATQNTAAAETR